MARLLVVDDAPDACEPLKRFLDQAGHEAHCAFDGHQALAFVINNAPDLVILDLLMPEMDGASFLEVIRSYSQLRQQPVVVLTALSEGPLVDRAMNAKVAAVLMKNKATYEDILKAVNESLSHLPA